MAVLEGFWMKVNNLNTGRVYPSNLNGLGGSETRGTNLRGRVTAKQAKGVVQQDPVEVQQRNANLGKRDTGRFYLDNLDSGSKRVKVGQ